LEILETRNGKSPTDPLTGDLIQAAQRGSWVIRQEVPYDNGSPRVLITLFDAFEQAVQHPDEQQPVLRMGRQTWVNLNTGLQARVQAFFRACRIAATK
jgi:hypothetical protein